jgi:hypothetical protein
MSATAIFTGRVTLANSANVNAPQNRRKSMLHRKPLTTAVMAAMGAMVTATVNVQADSVFFPHIVGSDTVHTIVSVVNQTNDLYNQTPTSAGDLHWRLMWKNAASLTDPCQEYNRFLPSSENDLQTVDLSGAIGDASRGVLFEDALAVGAGGNVTYGPDDAYNLVSQVRAGLGPNPPAVRGFLLIDNATSDGVSTFDDEPNIFGEAIIIEYAIGATWGYTAFTKANEEEGNPEPDEFDNLFDYEDAASQSGYPISFLPLVGEEQAVTALMVTPVVAPRAPRGESYADSDMSDAFGANSYRAFVRLVTEPDGDINDEASLYDRDENYFSGGRTEEVVCVGRVDVKNLFAAAMADSHPLANGGWGRVLNYANYTFLQTANVSGATFTQTMQATETSAAVIYKLEYGTSFNGLLPDMANSNATWNNAFLIPNDFEVYSD